MPLQSWSEYRFTNKTDVDIMDSEGEVLEDLLENHPIDHVAVMSSMGPSLPLASLFHHQCKISFVQQDNVDALRRQILSCKDGHYACLFCHVQEPSRYCKRFQGASDTEVCQAFQAKESPYLQCKSYHAGKGLQFLQNDTTNGVTSRFIRRSQDLVTRSRNPVDAVSQAITLTDKLAKQPISKIKLEENSVDLVISNLMLTHFENEPFNYFCSLMTQRFGEARLANLQEVTQPVLEKLQDRLFQAQAAQHFNEIFRLINKDIGQVYFSVGPIMDHYRSTNFPIRHLKSPYNLTEQFTETLKSA